MHDFNVYMVHNRDQLNNSIKELTEFADSTGSNHLCIVCIRMNYGYSDKANVYLDSALFTNQVNCRKYAKVLHNSLKAANENYEIYYDGEIAFHNGDLFNEGTIFSEVN